MQTTNILGFINMYRMVVNGNAIQKGRTGESNIRLRRKGTMTHEKAETEKYDRHKGFSSFYIRLCSKLRTNSFPNKKRERQCSE